MLEGDQMAKNIYEDIGVYLGYAIPFYSEFYNIKQFRSHLLKRLFFLFSPTKSDKYILNMYPDGTSSF